MATKVKLVADGVITPDQITLTTASTGTNTTAPATTAFVQQEITALVDSSPAALNTLNELAAALGDDPNFATTVNTNIATKLPLAGGTMTGALTINSGTANTSITTSSSDAANWMTMTDPSGSIFFGNSGANYQLWVGAAKQLEVTSSAATFTGTISSGAITSGAHLINASSSAFGGSSVQGFNTDFLVDTGQGYSRHNSYHTGGSNHQFLVNEAGSTTNAVALSIAKDKTVTFGGNATFSGTISSGAITSSGVVAATDLKTTAQTSQIWEAPSAASGNTNAHQMRIRWNASNDRWYIVPFPEGGAQYNREFYYDYNNGNWVLEGAPTITASGLHGTPNITVGTISSGAITADTSGSEIMELSRTGSATYDFTISDVGGGAAQLWFNAQTNDTGFNFRPKTSGGTNTNALFIDPDGHCGFGQTAPNTQIHVGDSTTTDTRIQITHENADGFGALDIDSYGSATLRLLSNFSGSTMNGVPNDTFGLVTPHNHSIVIGTSGDERMRVSNTGKIGINNDNPAAMLDIIGSGYEDIRLGSNRTDNTNKTAGITAYMYTNNTVSLFQMFNQNGSNITYYGSADGAHRGVQAHHFYVNTNYNATTGHTKAFEIRSDGDVHAAYTGSTDTTGYFYAGKDYGATNHRINRNVTQGSVVLVVSGYGGSGIGADTALFYACAQGGANASGAGMKIEKSSTNNRSINAAGTVNASGSDYAEYVKKSDTCGAIAKGDICGIDTNGKLTDKWSEAHSFVVKSTDPSYVGGDIWGDVDTVGRRPELTKQGYVNPEEKAPETDEEYAERRAQHEIDLAAFETALEEQRVKYDRIAFSGQVPCNLTGASVGDYIIPREGSLDSITGEAVSSPTFEEYQKAVGKVWKVLDNGNAWISVKIG